jgi:hypothetical protein
MGCNQSASDRRQNDFTGAVTIKTGTGRKNKRKTRGHAQSHQHRESSPRAGLDKSRSAGNVDTAAPAEDCAAMPVAAVEPLNLLDGTARGSAVGSSAHNALPAMPNNDDDNRLAYSNPNMELFVEPRRQSAAVHVVPLPPRADRRSAGAVVLATAQSPKRGNSPSTAVLLVQQQQQLSVAAARSQNFASPTISRSNPLDPAGIHRRSSQGSMSSVRTGSTHTTSRLHEASTINDNPEYVDMNDTTTSTAVSVAAMLRIATTAETDEWRLAGAVSIVPAMCRLKHHRLRSTREWLAEVGVLPAAVINVSDAPTQGQRLTNRALLTNDRLIMSVLHKSNKAGRGGQSYQIAVPVAPNEDDDDNDDLDQLRSGSLMTTTTTANYSVATSMAHDASAMSDMQGLIEEEDADMEHERLSELSF